MADLASLYYYPWVFFIFGSCFGSFFNVVFYRYPRGLSIVYPGSACPQCKKAIAGFDNIPILSWLVLRGRCRQCKTPISAKYPLNEVLFACLATVPVLLWRQTPWLGTLVSLHLVFGLPAVYLLFRHRRLPWWLSGLCLALLIFDAVKVFGS